MGRQTDICIIGGGPGGYVAAIRAAQAGKKVVVCEDHKMGGVCLHYGCIPTKTLLECAHAFCLISHAKTLGISVGKPKFSMQKAFEHVQNVSKSLYAGIQGLMKKHGVEVVASRARCKSPTTVVCQDGTEIDAKNIILATGSQPLVPPIPGIDVKHKSVLTSRTLLACPPEPKGHFVIIGAGPIGLEFASLYNMLGAQVTLVERQEQVLPQEDKVVAADLAASLSKKGVVVRTKTNVQAIKGTKAMLVGADNALEECVFDHVLVSAGIRPNTQDLGLDVINVERNERGFVTVSPSMETTCPGVYAIGDIVDGPALAHKASYEGMVCVDTIVGRPRERVAHHNIPRCVYTMPQVASVGWTEGEAQEKGLPVRVGTFPYMHNGRALSSGETEGFVKVLYHAKTGELLGAHILGENASELIHTVALSITAELTEAEFMATVFPHPTLSEMLQEATLSAYNKGLHA